MAIEGRLLDAAQFRLFQKLIADSIVYPKGDKLYVEYGRFRQAIVQGLAFLDLRGGSNELYDALNRLSVTITIEVVCLRHNSDNGGVEVLLTQLPDDQPDHSGRWSCPSATKLPEESDNDTLARIGQALAANISPKVMLGTSGRGSSGHHLLRFYYCEVTDSAKGSWFPTFPTIDLPPMDLTDWDVALFIRNSPRFLTA